MPQALIDILEEQSATGEADLEADINKVEEDDVVYNIIDVIFQPDEAEVFTVPQTVKCCDFRVPVPFD